MNIIYWSPGILQKEADTGDKDSAAGVFWNVRMFHAGFWVGAGWHCQNGTHTNRMKFGNFWEFAPAG